MYQVNMELEALTNVHQLWDSHCHLDFLIKFNRQYDEELTIDNVMRGEKYAAFRPSKFKGGCQVFCWPSTIAPRSPYHRQLSKYDQISYAFGVHPKKAIYYNARVESNLKWCLNEYGEKVVAIGECGLDFSGNFHSSKDIQISLFKKQINLAIDKKLPLILHVRSNKYISENPYKLAHDIVLEELEKRQIDKDEFKMHLHCFSSTTEDLLLWNNTFKNVFFGFTPVLCKQTRKNEALMDAVRVVSINRLLLETDSPHFVPPLIANLNEINISFPSFCYFTAKAISIIKGLPLDKVINSANRNYKQLYLNRS